MKGLEESKILYIPVHVIEYLIITFDVLFF